MAKKEIINNAAATVRVNEEPIKEVVDTAAEFASDVAEFAENFVEDTVDAVTKVYRNNPYVLAGVALIAGGTGAYLGYRYGIKKAGLRFDARLEEEIDAMRDHYKRVAKMGEYGTPQEAVEKLVPKAEAQRALTQYQGQKITHPVVPKPSEALSDEDMAAQVRAAERLESVTEPEVQVVSVFNDNHEQEWDYQVELSKRSSLAEDAPFVISKDEFDENEGGHNQGTLSYYLGDDVLTDERDEPISNTESVVGDDNLLRFGHGSGDPRTVYVRNPKLSMDWEIVKSDGRFDAEVLGFAPEIRHSHSRSTRRHRRDADE